MDKQSGALRTVFSSYLYHNKSGETGGQCFGYNGFSRSMAEQPAIYHYGGTHVLVECIVDGKAVPEARPGECKSDFMHSPGAEKLVARIPGVHRSDPEQQNREQVFVHGIVDSVLRLSPAYPGT